LVNSFVVAQLKRAVATTNSGKERSSTTAHGFDFQQPLITSRPQAIAPVGPMSRLRFSILDRADHDPAN
jgi:hypothetical protein